MQNGQKPTVSQVRAIALQNAWDMEQAKEELKVIRDEAAAALPVLGIAPGLEENEDELDDAIDGSSSVAE